MHWIEMVRLRAASNIAREHCQRLLERMATNQPSAGLARVSLLLHLSHPGDAAVVFEWSSEGEPGASAEASLAVQHLEEHGLVDYSIWTVAGTLGPSSAAPIGKTPSHRQGGDGTPESAPPADSVTPQAPPSPPPALLPGRGDPRWEGVRSHQAIVDTEPEAQRVSRVNAPARGTMGIHSRGDEAARSVRRQGKSHA